MFVINLFMSIKTLVK